MKKKINDLKQKYTWLKYIGNRYVLILLFFSIWMLFLDNYSYLDHRFLDKQIDELENNKKYYQEEIIRDSKNIKLLKNPNEVEKYAREKYYMKKDSEDIFIIDYEGDSIKK
jgi:cell division protein FtsB